MGHSIPFYRQAGQVFVLKNKILVQCELVSYEILPPYKERTLTSGCARLSITNSREVYVL